MKHLKKFESYIDPEKVDKEELFKKYADSISHAGNIFDELDKQKDYICNIIEKIKKDG